MKPYLQRNPLAALLQRCALLGAAAAAAPSQALEFQFDEWRLNVDTTLGYSAQWRTESRDDFLENSVNANDGNNNFDSGSLAVAALFEGKPVDARFSVVSVETGGEVGGGRTAAAGRALVLPPGRYRIAARGVKLKGDPRAEIDVDLSAGQVLEQRIELKPAN